MNVPLGCFLDFLEAKTNEGRLSVIKRYKRGVTEPIKGMVNYYQPVLQLMRGRLCAEGSLSEKLTALKEECVRDTWPDKLNEARVKANLAVYAGFRRTFGTKKLKFYPNPRMHCLISEHLAVNISPELYAEVDGVLSMWKVSMSKDCRKEQSCRVTLQSLKQASKNKGLDVPINCIYFLDLRSGRIFSEPDEDALWRQKLSPVAKALVTTWEAAA